MQSNSISRRSLLTSTLGAGALAGVSFGQSQPPNIVFILLDDLGPFDFGCYGQKLIATPNIDRLAGEGIRFTDCYAGGAVCAPSRSVLMTGLHTGHTPIRANAGTVPLLPADVTVARVLKTAGYATGAFGKWGLGDAGTTGAATRQGFDEFFGYLHQTHAHTYYPEYLRDGEEKFLLPGNANGKRGQYSANLIHERALQFIRKNQKRPFFLYDCTTLPHAYFEPPDSKPYSDRPWPEEQKNYAAMVTRADRHVGEILNLLRELKLEDNTVVFVSSDNGGTGKAVKFFNSNGPLRAQKGTVYEGGIRVPMIVRWPGKIQGKSTNSFPWAFCDVLPTLAEIAGAKTPKEIDGISVVPTLLGKKQDRELLYWEQHGYNRTSEKLHSMQQAARMGDWKAVRPAPDAPVELYNLREDVGEKVNVATQHPQIARELESYMKSQHGAPRPHNTGNWEYADKRQAQQ